VPGFSCAGRGQNAAVRACRCCLRGVRARRGDLRLLGCGTKACARAGGRRAGNVVAARRRHGRTAALPTAGRDSLFSVAFCCGGLGTPHTTYLCRLHFTFTILCIPAQRTLFFAPLLHFAMLSGFVAGSCRFQALMTRRSRSSLRGAYVLAAGLLPILASSSAAISTNSPPAGRQRWAHQNAGGVA